MKQAKDKAKIYEIFYKILRAALYFGVVGVGIAYLIFLFIGQERRILLNAEIVLLLAIYILWQADLIRKILPKSDRLGDKREKKQKIAAIIALVGGSILAASYAIMFFCKVSGVLAIIMGVIVLISSWTTVIALIVEQCVGHKDKAEEAEKDNSNDNETNE